MFYIYLQSSSASRQPKISNLMFLANPVYRVRSHPSAWHLKTFQWHGWTRSSNNSIFLFEIYQFFVGKYSTFIYKPQALLESEKNANVIRFADLVHRVRRDPSVTLRKFSPDTTGHGLRITKRPAVWYFSIFLFEKYQFLLEIFYLHLESSSASRKWKNLNVVLFADSVHRVRRDPSVTLSSDSSGQNSKYCKETVKWRTANVFTVKYLTICLGWLLRKTILEGFINLGVLCYRKLGRGARCIKGDKVLWRPWQLLFGSSYLVHYLHLTVTKTLLELTKQSWE